MELYTLIYFYQTVEQFLVSKKWDKNIDWYKLLHQIIMYMNRKSNPYTWWDIEELEYFKDINDKHLLTVVISQGDIAISLLHTKISRHKPHVQPKIKAV